MLDVVVDDVDDATNEPIVAFTSEYNDDLALSGMLMTIGLGVNAGDVNGSI